MRAYAPAVSIRKLLTLFVAIVVLFAPSLTRAGEALAAVPGHQKQMMDSGHCKSLPSDNSDQSAKHRKSGVPDEAMGKTCCMAMCMAVALSPPVSEHTEIVHSTRPVFPLLHQYHGRITEIATPPPRRA